MINFNKKRSANRTSPDPRKVPQLIQTKQATSQHYFINQININNIIDKMKVRHSSRDGCKKGNPPQLHTGRMTAMDTIFSSRPANFRSKALGQCSREKRISKKVSGPLDLCERNLTSKSSHRSPLPAQRKLSVLFKRGMQSLSQSLT